MYKYNKCTYNIKDYFFERNLSWLGAPSAGNLLVHNYILEQDPTKKKEELTELKRKYPSHWMVKDL